jgi:hypothetical protein
MEPRRTPRAFLYVIAAIGVMCSSVWVSNAQFWNPGANGSSSSVIDGFGLVNGDLDFGQYAINDLGYLDDGSADPSDAGLIRSQNNRTSILACELASPGADMTFGCNSSDQWVSNSSIVVDPAGSAVKARMSSAGLAISSDASLIFAAGTNVSSASTSVALSSTANGRLRLADSGGVRACLNYNGTSTIAFQQGNCSTYTPITADSMTLIDNQLTTATMTSGGSGQVKHSTHEYNWTNAMVVALGATTSGNISVVTLPAKTIVTNAYVVISTACAGPATLTVSLGRVAANYDDYIVASDATAAANTIYGDASAERGTGLTGYDLPSYTGTTTLNARFVSTGGNLSTVTTCTGSVLLETALLP